MQAKLVATVVLPVPPLIPPTVTIMVHLPKRHHSVTATWIQRHCDVTAGLTSCVTFKRIRLLPVQLCRFRADSIGEQQGITLSIPQTANAQQRVADAFFPKV